LLQQFQLIYERLPSEEEVGRIWHLPTFEERLYEALGTLLKELWYNTRLLSKVGLDGLENILTQPGLKPIILAYFILTFPLWFT